MITKPLVTENGGIKGEVQREHFSARGYIAGSEMPHREQSFPGLMFYL